MGFVFATCDRKRALEFIQKVYPSKNITDTEDSAGPLLDFVSRDIVRIQDPMMHGASPQVVPGKNWKEDPEIRQKVIDACNIFHKD